MDGRKMAIVPFKLWEDMKRWKEEQIQKPRLPPDPNVSATASLQRDLSSVMANEDLSEAEKSQLYGQTLHKESLTLAMGKCLWFSVKIKVCQSSLYLP